MIEREFMESETTPVVTDEIAAQTVKSTQDLATEAATARMVLIARYPRTLRNKNGGTHQKGYGSNGENFQDNEEIVIKKRVGRTDLVEAGIIIDIAGEKVLKNRFGDQPFEELFKYFMNNYSQQINEWVKLEIAKNNAKQPTFTVG